MHLAPAVTMVYTSGRRERVGSIHLSRNRGVTMERHISGSLDPAALREAADQCFKAADELPAGPQADAMRQAGLDYLDWADRSEHGPMLPSR